MPAGPNTTLTISEGISGKCTPNKYLTTAQQMIPSTEFITILFRKNTIAIVIITSTIPIARINGSPASANACSPTAPAVSPAVSPSSSVPGNSSNPKKDCDIFIFL